MAKKVEEAYGWLAKEDVRREFERRQSILSGTVNGAAWFDAGLMAMVLEDFPAASKCFLEATKDPEIQANPFPHAYLGRSLLFAGSLGEATPEYEKAMQLASVDKATLFRARHMFLSDLLEVKKVNEVLKYAPACLSSDYPLERAWALENWIYYQWSKGVDEELGRRIVELRKLFPTLIVRPDLPFEQDRYELTQTLLSEVERAAQGDPVMLMAMDEEATTFDFINGDFEKAIERLKPWVEKYPIKDYASFNDYETKKFAIWVNYVTACALARLDRFVEAEPRFREIIQFASFKEFSGRIVDSYGWLGYTLKAQKRLEEALEALETCLALDVSGVDEKVVRSLPYDFSQLRVKDGQTTAVLRTSLVKQYEETRDALQKAREGGLR